MRVSLKFSGEQKFSQIRSERSNLRYEQKVFTDGRTIHGAVQFRRKKHPRARARDR